jgi:hypothetical protein
VNKKIMMTAFASTWLIFSCATHAGMVYELDCGDAKCGDGITLSGSIELEDGVTLANNGVYYQNDIKGGRV